MNDTETAEALTPENAVALPPMEERIRGSHVFYSGISLANPRPKDEVLAHDPEPDED